MNLFDAALQLKKLEVTVFTTNDAATLLQITSSHASHILNHLGKAGILFKLYKGLWGFKGQVDRLALPSYLSAPFPAYISLQTALQIHGIIEQIPEVVYAVSTARTRRYKTKIATISLHHLNMNFFFGYEYTADPAILIATPEKALIDYLYFKPGKSGYFKALPEIDLTNIDKVKAIQYIEKIPYIKRRVMVMQNFSALYQQPN